MSGLLLPFPYWNVYRSCNVPTNHSGFALSIEKRSLNMALAVASKLSFIFCFNAILSVTILYAFTIFRCFSIGGTGNFIFANSSHGILPRTPPTAIKAASLSNSGLLNHISKYSGKIIFLSFTLKIGYAGDIIASSYFSNLATGIFPSRLTCIKLTAKSFLRIILYFERSVPFVFATDLMKHLSILTPINSETVPSLFLSSTLVTSSSMVLYISSPPYPIYFL